MTDEKDLYASGEPGLSYDPLEIDEGWEPPYRNKNACLEQKLAKEIGEMSDEAVEVAVKKYFGKNPCNEIEIGIMDCEKQVKQAVAPLWQNIDALQKELNEFRYLYGSVISRINKLEDDTRAAIEFADLAEDDKGTEMILEFCEDITKLAGE